jgi:ubiquinone/menaquinone biosynthesis C-methylase UbiE
MLSGCRSAVTFGDGDGRFLARLLAQNPALHATAVDISREMLQLLSQRCRTASQGTATPLVTLHQDALHYTGSTDTDLVVTNFFLDCFAQAEVDLFVRRIASQLQPGTLWLVSDFRIPARGLARPLAHIYIRALYTAFGVLTGLRTRSLPDIESAMLSAGFRLTTRREWLFGLVYSELWTLK